MSPTPLPLEIVELINPRKEYEVSSFRVLSLVKRRDRISNVKCLTKSSLCQKQEQEGKIKIGSKEAESFKSQYICFILYMLYTREASLQLAFSHFQSLGLNAHRSVYFSCNRVCILRCFSSCYICF